MTRHRGPAWRGLYALYARVRLISGLLMAEHRASLPPAGHTFVRIGIVLFVYGLVWLWLRANAVALLRAGQDAPVRADVYEPCQAAPRSGGRTHGPRPARIRYSGVHQTAKRLQKQTSHKEMDRCSLN